VPPLSVLCHRCGQAFPSEVSLTERGLSGQLLEGVVYECPHCGTRDPYFTAEHHVSVSGGFATGSSSYSGWLRRLHSRLAGVGRFVPAVSILVALLILTQGVGGGPLPFAV